jgi:hypothetical protein
MVFSDWSFARFMSGDDTFLFFIPQAIAKAGTARTILTGVSDG